MASSSAARSTSYALDATAEPDLILGSTTPRVWTPPLRELTRKTSYGFELNDFAAEVLGEPFDPWQEWLSIHVGERLPDGRPRFRKVLILVARQNGKTHWAKTLVKYWLFLERIPTILGTSTDRSYAKRTWQQIVEESKDNEWLAEGIGPNSQRKSIGEETFVTLNQAEYTFAANNKRAGRSMTLHKWLCDEVREHRDLDTWNAASKAQNAVSTAQTIAISNQGDATAVVLDMLHVPALEYIETDGREGDPRLGLFEWSAPLDCEPDDVEGLRMANPNLNRPGHGPELEVLLADGRQAKRAGGAELTGQRTEVMCQRVARLSPAIDAGAWGRRLEIGDLSAVRRRVACCLDVAPDGEHVTLVSAAVLPDERVRVEPVCAWESTAAALAALPGLLAEIRPQAFGWFPDGPSAALAAKLASRHKRRGWPPVGMKVEEIRSELPAVCMGLADLVKSGGIVHSGDPLADAQVGAAEKLKRGAGWVFVRGGAEHVDAVYAMAGAAHLARTLPPPIGKPRLRVVDDTSDE